jgi:hypothetical protein
VRRAAFEPQFSSLEKELDKCEKKKRSEEEVEVGKVYLADCQEADDNFFRVEVLNN